MQSNGKCLCTLFTECYHEQCRISNWLPLHVVCEQVITRVIMDWSSRATHMYSVTLLWWLVFVVIKLYEESFLVMTARCTCMHWCRLYWYAMSHKTPSLYGSADLYLGKDSGGQVMVHTSPICICTSNSFLVLLFSLVTARYVNKSLQF